MSSPASFDQLYQSQLLPALQSLEQSRKNVLNALWVAIAWLLTALPFLLMAVKIGHPVALLLLVPSIIFSIFKFIDHEKKKKAYKLLFKEEVIGAMVKLIDAKLNYAPASCISEQEYVASGIFRDRIDRYSGDDLVEGKLGATAVKFSEVHHQEKQVTVDSKGHRHESWITIFKGIFFIADFNKNFSGSTFVLPDAGNTFLGIGRLFEKWTMGRGELVKLENPDFEKLFTVYGTDQVEARYILSPAMMERLVQFRQKAASRLHLSFIHSTVYMAISLSKSLFEPNVFSSGIRQDYLQEYFNYIDLVTGIVDDLNLNTRIWGRD
ncbi:MAG TPA: DUF3137 domain-containing protein [Chitinophagales bacterium]|nr:DUF3137 domain-containing protein [Chitinophagales bacterium]